MTAPVRDVFLFDLAPIEAAPISVDQPIESEIQLCRTGAFYRADMGHFKVTQRTLEKMAANVIERGVDIPISYYHKGSDQNASIEERRSAGKISPASLSIRSFKGGHALYGVARWTAEAAKKIKAGEVNYISPEIEWSSTRLAASPAGPAGEAIGPLLTAASLVDDPFFNMNPVTFSRNGAPQRGLRSGASKRYSMLTDAKKAAIEKLLKAAGIEAAALPGLMAQILVEIMSEEAMPEPVVEEVAVPANATPPADGAAAQSLAAARESNAALAKRVAELEARDRTRETEQAEQLFARYQSEGRYRVYAIAGSDPDGTKKAKALLTKGVAFFREVFDAIPPLVGATPPAAPPGLNRNQGNPNAMSGDDNGAALHARVMGEIKAKNLKMTDYNRLAAQFSRG